MSRTAAGARATGTALVAAFTLTLMLLLGACGSGRGTSLALVAFSVPKPAYDDLQTHFARISAGRGTSWTSSYGASGNQARSVIAGQDADYVSFSLGSDMTKLASAGLVDSSWNAGPTRGIVSTSVVVIAVRKGNPKHITGWADLLKPGIRIVIPNPGSSGSARWNVMAAYSQITANGGSQAQGVQYLTSFYKNVVSLPSSGRDATTAFTGGTGDVLLSYENEAIVARQHHQFLDYLVPSTTLRIDNPGAVTKKAGVEATQFLDYVESAAGQRIFAVHGFRPFGASVSPGTVQGANDPTHPFPAVGKLVTIAQLGGWAAVNKTFFDPKTGIVTKIQGENRS